MINNVENALRAAADIYDGEWPVTIHTERALIATALHLCGHLGPREVDTVAQQHTGHESWREAVRRAVLAVYAD